LMEVYARRIDAKHALFVFDSCFSGSLFALSRAVPAVIGYKTARPVRQFITSGTADETVPDQSVFRRQFVAALAGKADGNGDGYVTGAELGEYLQDRVTNYTYNAQHPQYGKIRDPLLDEGDFVFRVAKAAPPTSPAPPPPPPLAVARVGGVQVNVNVADAAVSIAGEPAGQAAPGRPVNRWAVPAGETEVTVSAPGYLATRRRVTVEAGKWVQVQVDLERAAPPPVTLTVRSNVYGDRVLVDGRPHGPTPLNLRLAPGEHSVRVEKDGYEPFEKRVMLYADKTIMASLNRQIQAAPTAAAPPPTPQPTAAGPSRGTWREPETDMELLWVPGGCYTMGYDDSAHLPAHTVCVKGFWVGKYEVTVTQFKRFVQATDYAGQGRNGWYCGRGMAQPSRPQQEGDHPVLCVSWHEAQAMAQWLSQRHGSPGRFRLPTEAEWEYACRSGGRAELYSGGQDVDRVAWYKHNSGGATHSVGTRTPNGLGLHDLSGNAREWVMDSDVGDGYRRHTRDDPVIISDRVKAKVMRGGSWANPASRATCRRSWSENQDLRSALNGFRLVRTP
jgi:formylglycine-generating enzyme required for sulfatase activity